MICDRQKRERVGEGRVGQGLLTILYYKLRKLAVLKTAVANCRTFDGRVEMICRLETGGVEDVVGMKLDVQGTGQGADLFHVGVLRVGTAHARTGSHVLVGHVVR